MYHRSRERRRSRQGCRETVDWLIGQKEVKPVWSGSLQRYGGGGVMVHV